MRAQKSFNSWGKKGFHGNIIWKQPASIATKALQQAGAMLLKFREKMELKIDVTQPSVLASDDQHFSTSPEPHPVGTVRPGVCGNWNWASPDWTSMAMHAAASSAWAICFDAAIISIPKMIFLSEFKWKGSGILMMWFAGKEWGRVYRNIELGNVCFYATLFTFVFMNLQYFVSLISLSFFCNLHDSLISNKLIILFFSYVNKL